MVFSYLFVALTVIKWSPFIWFSLLLNTSSASVVKEVISDVGLLAVKKFPPAWWGIILLKRFYYSIINCRIILSWLIPN